MSEGSKWILWTCIIILGSVGNVYLQEPAKCIEIQKAMMFPENGGVTAGCNCTASHTHYHSDNNGRCYCIESLDDESCGKCGDKENATCGYNLVAEVVHLRVRRQACNDSTFGPNCTTPCNCKDWVQCYPNGTCPNGCADGFTINTQTTLCTECDVGKFGTNCSETCHCINSTDCNPVNGSCSQGCDPMYTGPTCQDQEISTSPSSHPTLVAPVPPTTADVSAGQPPPSAPDLTSTPTAPTPASDQSGTANTSDLSQMLIPILAGIGGFLFLVLIVLLCVFCYRKRNTREKAMSKPLNAERGGFDEVDGVGPSTETNADDKRPNSQVSGVVKMPSGYDRMEEHAPSSYSVAVGDLEEKIKKERETEEVPFKTEYERIPEGQTAPWDFGMKKNVHRDKNRFGNIVAYDHSRAVLIRRKDDASEYINANFIDGYNHEKAFIATQGPMDQTVADFWRMCWEHQVPIIVMVTNVIENGREKCTQYWPKFRQSMTVGDLNVTTMDEKVFADFIIRTFQVKQGEEMRLVKHYQFTGWPDHGVPRQATPLLTLRRRVRSEMAGKAGITGPTVVHCSAGVGRSGTFIAIDYLMNQAEAEQKIDVFECVWKMRYNRVNMVQTWDQYNFIYDALLEAVTVGQTTIPCYQFTTIYPEWLEKDPTTKVSKLQQQLRILDVVKTKYTETDYEAGRKKENRDKNRKADVLPVNYFRPYLQTRVEGRNEYINAVFLQGYFKRDAFLITQSPLPDTRVDLWRMVMDYECRTIVSLQDYTRTEADTDSGEVDESTPPPWPEEGGTMTFGPFTVQTIKSSVSPTQESVRITDVTVKIRKEQRVVQIFSPMDFPANELDPLPHKTFIALKEDVKRWQQRSGDKTVVVMCKNGVERSGLYCAMDYVIEMIEVERDVDVFQATRQVQTSRTCLIPNIDQYKYLYEIAEVYMEINGAYENFS